MYHARDMVWLGFKPWKGSMINARPNEGASENGAVEKAMIPSLWKFVFAGSKAKKNRDAR